jgi:hypothetical protein
LLFRTSAFRVYSLGYDGRLGGGYTSHAGTASLRVTF